MREEKSGLRGVRALALQLPRRGALQISMNLEDPTVTPPVVVFNRLELLIQEAGGAVTETEIIGLMPDQLALSGVDVERVGEDVHGVEANGPGLLQAEARALARLGEGAVDEAEFHGVLRRVGIAHHDRRDGRCPPYMISRNATARCSFAER